MQIYGSDRTRLSFFQMLTINTAGPLDKQSRSPRPNPCLLFCSRHHKRSAHNFRGPSLENRWVVRLYATPIDHGKMSMLTLTLVIAIYSEACRTRI